MYAILDGHDLGMGVIHLFLARKESDRRLVLSAAGPFRGNEIWLLLAGGALYGASPAVHTSRGFYPAFIIMLCVLILRRIGIEFRNRVENPNWRRRLDVALAGGTLLLATSIGTAVGYAIRSVTPVFGSGIGNWLPILCGACGLAVLTLQSAAWMALKSNGELQQRCRRLASAVWWAVVLCGAGVMGALAAQPDMLENLLTHSWIGIFVVMALAGMIGTRLCLSVEFDLGTFASASCVVAGLLASAATGLTINGLTVSSAASGQPAISGGTMWWIPALVVAAGFNLWMHRLAKPWAGRGPAS